jgi:hypothetical protein
MLNVDKALTKQVISDLQKIIDETITDNIHGYFSDLMSATNDIFYFDDTTTDMYFTGLTGTNLLDKLTALKDYYQADDTLLSKIIDDKTQLMEYLAYQQLNNLLTSKQGFNDDIVKLVGLKVETDSYINPDTEIDINLLDKLDNLLTEAYNNL